MYQHIMGMGPYRLGPSGACESVSNQIFGILEAGVVVIMRNSSYFAYSSNHPSPEMPAVISECHYTLVSAVGPLCVLKWRN